MNNDITNYLLHKPYRFRQGHVVSNLDFEIGNDASGSKSHVVRNIANHVACDKALNFTTKGGDLKYINMLNYI